MSTTILNRLAQCKAAPVTLLALPQKRSRNPELRAFGAMLKDLRGSRTRQQIANRLSDLGVPLDASSLFQYEAGTVWAPDAGVLWGLAEIYRVPVGALIELLRANRRNPEIESFGRNDLSRHDGTRDSALPKGGATGDLTTRERLQHVEYLEQRLLFYEELVEHARADAARTLATLSPESGEGPRPQSGHRRRTRKVR